VDYRLIFIKFEVFLQKSTGSNINCGLVLTKVGFFFAKYPGHALRAVGSGDWMAGDFWPTWLASLAGQAAAFHSF
jgi:hypothetical protein